MLHQHIINFFNRIEFEAGDFTEDFFDDDFKNIVKRHPKILKERCEFIQSEMKSWTQVERSSLCKQVRESNDIEGICKGVITPTRISKNATAFQKLLKQFFLDLYNQVLDGAGFNEFYKTTLREHFDGFSRRNKKITKCPICGISELKKDKDECRDQYDHFSPKTLYPFSSVNFENLVLSCKECNSFEVKGDKDTIAVSTGKLYYPYDSNHKGILINFHIATDDLDIENITWQIEFVNPDDAQDETASWRAIYSIDSRYQGFVKARIEKWHRHYWNTTNSSVYKVVPERERDNVYFESLRNDEEIELDFIRLPSLRGFLDESVLAQANLQSKFYS